MRWTKEQYAAYQARRALPHTKQREQPTALAANCGGETPGTGCVPVSFILYRVRLLDVEAKYGSVKDLLDCVVHAGFVAGDQEGQVDLKVRQVKVDTFAEERTEIEIG